jgi:transposase InsO family protein
VCPIAPNALWALDFQFDTTTEGRTVKMLNVIDEYTRECPAIVVGRSIDADAVVATLDRLTAQRGAPAFVRFDNGPEFIANAVADWCRFNDVDTVFIDPGSLADRGPRDHRDLANPLQQQPPPHRTRRSHTQRVRPQWTTNQPQAA